ncbi:biotin--[acetyl-CoA-carboxylase] ligase [Luteolibacter pohnpeiensis]|nr:biotin--[acetyl-CoA-carboxylase] ligase [Luteolibacter pohnpeiensis]
MIRDSVGSTNDDLRELAEHGTTDGMILLAREQTNGRGRRGASWFSATGEALAFSILVRPSEPRHLWPRLALAAGLAVAEAIDSQGIAAQIKWPNDVQISGKKVAGILVESGPDFAIVGIGLNVNARSFPPEVADIATSLALAGDREIPMAEVFAAIIHRFSVRRSQIGDDFPEMISDVRTRCSLTGKKVRLRCGDLPKTGVITGIGDNGELLLQNERGEESILQADEIRLIA